MQAAALHQTAVKIFAVKSTVSMGTQKDTAAVHTFPLSRCDGQQHARPGSWRCSAALLGRCAEKAVALLFGGAHQFPFRKPLVSPPCARMEELVDTCGASNRTVVHRYLRILTPLLYCFTTEETKRSSDAFAQACAAGLLLVASGEGSLRLHHVFGRGPGSVC